MMEQMFKDVDAMLPPDTEHTINRREFVKYVSQLQPSTEKQRVEYVLAHAVRTLPFWSTIALFVAMIFFLGHRKFLWPSADPLLKKQLVQAGAFLLLFGTLSGILLAFKAQRHKFRAYSGGRLALKGYVYARVLHRTCIHGDYSKSSVPLVVEGDLEVKGGVYKNMSLVRVTGDMLVSGEVYKNKELVVSREGGTVCIVC
jgi:hypothetical protein